MTKETKCILVGDGAVGKTCVLLSYVKGKFDKNTAATAFDSFSVDVEVNGETAHLEICDFGGQEVYDSARRQLWPTADVVLLCFSTVYRDSFRNVKTYWLPEIRDLCPNRPIILVGTKIDLRDKAQKGEESVTSVEGLILAREIGAAAYVECSAQTGDGVKNVFDHAFRATLPAKQEQKQSKQACNCM